MGSRSRRHETRQFYEGRGGSMAKHNQGVVSVDKIIRRSVADREQEARPGRGRAGGVCTHACESGRTRPS